MKKMKKMKKGSSMNDHISEDIIFNILLLLSIKTVLRCKSVCKLWYKIIDDPNFSYNHSQKIQKSSFDNFLLQGFEVRSRKTGSPKQYGFLPFLELDKSSDDESIYLRRPKQGRRWVPPYIACVVGSCNGLICLKVNERHVFQIMNPLYSVTDTYQLEIPSHLRDMDVPVGFGFDKFSQKFKVVCLLVCEAPSHECSVRLFVHELGNPTTSSWRELSQSIGHWYFFPSFGRSAVFVNGSIHWLAVASKVINPPNRFYTSMVSFNLTTEEFVIKHLDAEGLYPGSGLYPNCGASLLDLNGTLVVVLPEDDVCIRILGLCGDADNMIEDSNEITTKKLVNKFCIKFSSPSIDIVGILKARHILIMNKNPKEPHFSYDMQTGIFGIIAQVPELSYYAYSLLCHQGSLIRPSDLACLCNSV